MPASCSVRSCKINANYAKIIGVKVSFFKFPREETLKKAWVEKCDRTDKINFRNARVCSMHFKAEDFERDLRAELLQQPSRLILKSNAIPSSRVGESSTLDDEPSKQTLPLNEVVETETADINMEASINNCLQCNNLLASVDELKGQIIELTAGNSLLKKQMLLRTNALKLCRQKINSLQTNRRKVERKKETTTDLQRALSDIFTPAQMKLLLNKKKIVHWNEEDVIKAFTLRYFSKRSYTYLREDLKYPLPGEI